MNFGKATLVQKLTMFAESMEQKEQVQGSTINFIKRELIIVPAVGVITPFIVQRLNLTLEPDGQVFMNL